jgi:hypothetical protein
MFDTRSCTTTRIAAVWALFHPVSSVSPWKKFETPSS